MQDRRSVRGALLRGAPIKIVVEDGLDGAIGARADINGAFRRRFDASDAIGTGKADDPQTRPVALFRMRSMLENLLAERRSRRSDRARVLADAVDRPARIAAVGGRHVFGDRRMFAIAADAQMRGDPLAFEENLDRPGGHPDVHLGAGEAIGNAVIVRAGVDVIIDADPTDAPFAEDIGLGRQRLERRTVDLLQQLPASHAEPPDGPFFVQMLE